MGVLSINQILKWIRAFIGILTTGEWKRPWFQAAFCLFIMGSQWTLIEGWHGVSMVKVGFMCLTPLFMLSMVEHMKLGVIIHVCGLYFGLVCLSAFVLSDGVFKTSSICYMLLYILMYCYFMSLIYSGAFTYEFYANFLRGMLLGYFYLLILQQVTAVLHINYIFRLFNCYGFLWGWKFPCMNLEPSHAARMILGIAIALVELLHIRQPSARGLQYLWKYERMSAIAFCYSELTSGGSTGIVAFLVMGLYVLFYSKRSAFIGGLIGFAILLYLVKDTVAMQRFIVSAQATATMNEDNIWKADTSAAMRITILTQTIRTLSFNDYGFWVGYGFNPIYGGIGVLVIYGFFAYMAQLLFLFKYAFKGIFDIRFFVFVLFLWATLGNVAHAWAIIMYWSTTKYFELKYEREQWGRRLLAESIRM